MKKLVKERRKFFDMFLESTILYLVMYFVAVANAAGYDFGRNSPLQMDVTAAKEITICTGMKRAIACRDGSNIAITHAFWGRVSDKVCPSDDGDPVTDCEGAEETIDLVRGYCEGKPGCTLQARHQYLQKNGTHHCPGVNKYLVVNYTCIPDSKGVVLCDSEEASLECKAGWKIDITDAFWGRRANSKYCPTGMQEMECDNGPSAKTNLKKKCDGLSSCVVKATSDELEDKKTVCPGNLLYLLLNYACRSSSPKGTKTVDVDDDTDASVENKLLADTSSKELMGLLEKHLNELQSKPTAKDKKESVDADEEKETKSASKKPSSSSGSSKPKSSGKKTAKTDAKTDEKTASELTPQQSATTAGYVRTLQNAAEQKETPAMDMKETDASKKSQETVPAAATGEKKQILPKASIETPVDEPTYEVSEPGTVKSILARAKEVLKSLDDEKEETSEETSKDAANAKKSEKKSAIERKNKSEDNNSDEEKDAKSVKQVAKLAANLVKTANKYKDGKMKAKDAKAKDAKATADSEEKGSKANVQQLRSEKKPKPGPKKIGLSATGPGRAGMGNTP